MVERLSLPEILFLLFVVVPFLLSLFAAEITLIVIAVQSVVWWIEDHWWKK